MPARRTRARLAASTPYSPHRIEPLEPRRLLSAGALDPTFGGDGKVTTDLVGDLTSRAGAVTVAGADGKLLVVGTTDEPDWTHLALARLNPDGSPDRSFGDNGAVVTDFREDRWNSAVHAEVLDDGSILVGTPVVVALFHADGTLDHTFGQDGATALSPAPGGKVVVARGSDVTYDAEIARYNADGSPDATFGDEGRVRLGVRPGDGIDDDGSEEVVNDVYVLPDGGILVGGRSDYKLLLARYRPDGSLEPTFGAGGEDGDGIVTTAFPASGAVINDLTLWRGRIVAVGTVERYVPDRSVGDFAFARYSLATGTLDRSFSGDGLETVDFAGGKDEANAVLMRPDGAVIAAGYATLPETKEDFAMAALDFRGRPLRSFGNGGKVTTNFGTAGGPTLDRGADATFTPGGKIVLAGAAQGSPYYETRRFGLTQYLADGALDRTFGGGDGKATFAFRGSLQNAGTDGAVQRDGKVVVVGASAPVYGIADVMLARYNLDGSLDSTFGRGGADGDGIVVTDLSVAHDGSSMDWAASVTVDRFGRILVTGTTDRRVPAATVGDPHGGDRDVFVARYRRDGTLDRSFGGGDGLVVTNLGNLNDYAQAIAVAPDGKIAVAGSTQNPRYTEGSLAVLRYLANGTPDTTFSGDGIALTGLFTYPAAGGVTFQGDGRIVAVGSTWDGFTSNDFTVLRYLPDGSPDRSFGGGDGSVVTDFGAQTRDEAHGVTLDGDGRIVVAGSSQDNTFQGTYRSTMAVARYLRDGSPDASFGGGTGRAVFDSTPDDTSTAASDVHVQRDGKLVLIGTLAKRVVNTPNHVEYRSTDFAAVRLRADGTSDPTFGTGGLSLVHFDGSPYAVGGGIDPMGRLILAGSAGSPDAQPPTGEDFAVVRMLLE
jgi:uncharacterized delta-60 repeat protein